MTTRNVTNRAIRAGAVVAGLVVVLAGCDDTPAQPTTVVVNTPPADGGQLVLLTVMIGAAFIAVALAVIFAWAWAQERHARREAEDALLTLTGQPIDRIRLAIRQQPWPSDGQAGDRPTASRSREIKGWHE